MNNKQTIRMYVKKGLDHTGRKQYIIALRQSASVLSVSLRNLGPRSLALDRF